MHERHWDDDVLPVIPLNLPDRRDRKSPPQGEILIVSARWHGYRFFHHEPDFLGVKISDLERRSRSRLASVVFPAPKGPFIQIIIVDGL